MELLADLNSATGRTIVAVLHDLNLAARSIPRIVVLDGGRLVADGPPDDGARRATGSATSSGVDPAMMPGGSVERGARR